MYIYFLLILQYLLCLHAIAINVALRQCGGVAVEGRIKKSLSSLGDGSL